METNCTAKASEWQRAGECQTPMLKDDEARAWGFYFFCFVGDSDLTDPDIKCSLKRTRTGRTGFRQAAVKLGELTVAALFLAGDMGWEMGRIVCEGGTCAIPQRLCAQPF